MSFSSTSFERLGSPVPEDLTRATKKVKNKSIDDQVLGDMVMKDGLQKVPCQDKFVGNVEGRGSKEEAVLEQELEITEDDYMINTEGDTTMEPRHHNKGKLSFEDGGLGKIFSSSIPILF
ncbi:hypothetical protein Godav_011795 [Gossypium davidsonii]|uniref:Uncharacterized protein n=1 Tax=Gossypium davidsonii TaxID=34287 RepID=A0A7J8RCK8_GOSDV|nr:hypothetical protein [Gossypium davidsonii]